MLFIDHHQLQVRRGCKYGHPRAQYHACRAAVRGDPAAQPLRIGHATVQCNDGLLAILGAKALPEQRLQLWREVDLGHHHDRLGQRVTLQHLLHALQIDFGLAAAGGSKQQTGGFARSKTRQHCTLLRAQVHGGRRDTISAIGCHTQLALQAALELALAQFAQLRRQRGKGDFTERALVIAGGKSDQLAPARGKWRHARQHRADITQFAGGNFRCIGSGD